MGYTFNQSFSKFLEFIGEAGSLQEFCKWWQNEGQFNSLIVKLAII